MDLKTVRKLAMTVLRTHNEGMDRPRILPFEVWVNVYPAPDAEGQWVSVSPSFGLVMGGNTASQALSEMQKAVEWIVLNDLKNGLDPRGRRLGEDDEYWAAIFEIVRNRTQFVLSEGQSENRPLVARYTLGVVLREKLVADPLVVENSLMKLRPPYAAAAG